MLDYFLFDISLFMKFFLKSSTLPPQSPTVTARLDVLSLNGEHLLQMSVGCKSVADIYNEVDAFLQHKFIFSLIHGETDVADMQFNDLQEPIILIKTRGPFPYGLHGILRQIGGMCGSQKMEHLLDRLEDSPGKLPATPAKLYGRLFYNCRHSGYILQGRVMSLYSLLIREGAIASEVELLKEVEAIDRDRAIRKLIQMHNDRQVDLERVWFGHGAREVGMQLR